jgi:predicted molibdopterin-dependent oxidoreductase YjgC
MVLARAAEAFAPAEWDATLDAVSARLRSARAAAVVVSARATNEETYLASRLARALSARLAGVSWSPADATGDDFLLKADKNPNGMGLAQQGIEQTGVLDAVLAGIERGEIDAAVVLRSDLVQWLGRERVAPLLERLDYLVVIDTDGCETAQYANVVLPIGTYLETDGTFMNHAGRVQRLRQAIVPPGEARPGWQVLADLVGRLGEEDVPSSAAATFAALAGSCAAFEGLDYDAVGAQGAPAAG